MAQFRNFFRVEGNKIIITESVKRTFIMRFQILLTSCKTVRKRNDFLLQRDKSRLFIYNCLRVPWKPTLAYYNTIMSEQSKANAAISRIVTFQYAASARF